MGLDDLIRLLFILGFLWPFLSGLFRRKPPQGQGGRKGQGRRGQKGQQGSSSRRQTAGPAQGRSATQTAERRPRTGIPQTTSADASGAGDFEKRLAEARRRVREAMGEAASEAAGETQTSDGGLFKESKSAPASRPEPAAIQAVPTNFLPPDSQTAIPNFAQESEALQVQRLGRRSRGSKRAKTGGRMLELDRRSIMQGLIWQQVLSDPKAKEYKAKRPARQGKARRTP